MTLLALPRDRWNALIGRMALAVPADAFDQIAAAYSEGHRAYHTTEHLLECLAEFDGCRDLCERADEVEFALWLHDAVYKTRSSDSELKSAEWAVKLLTEGGADADAAERVHAMIMGTLHTDHPTEGDGALMLDIDLSILGRGEERFDRYEADVRREYKWVPGPLFRSKRRGMLEQFLERPFLYATERFRRLYESQARANLTRSIERLARG